LKKGKTPVFHSEKQRFFQIFLRPETGLKNSEMGLFSLKNALF